MKNPSKQGCNYLVICNAPYKHNARLNQTLLEELGNIISYGDENKKEIKSDSLSSNPKDYDLAINYSKYKIIIKDEITKPYVISLSPFVFIPQKEYDSYKAAKKDFDTMYSPYSDDIEQMRQYSSFLENNRDKILSFNFIESLFQQENNKSYFLEQENKYFKESIKYLQSYIDSIHCNDFNRENIKDYSILEVILLALTYYVIKNFYTLTKTDIQDWSDFILKYENIEIDGETLKILPYDSFLVLEDKSKIPLCFSKQRKEELSKQYKEIFCIEEFVVELENEENIDEMEIDRILEEFLKIEDSSLDSSHLEILEKKSQKIKASQSLQIIIEQFITSFFPFASLFFDLTPFNISKNLIKILISYKIKGLKEILFEELGLVSLFYSPHNDSIKIPNLKSLKNYTKDSMKDLLKNIPQAIGLRIFNQAFITHYEKIKKEFERLRFTKLAYKYHPPYVLKRENEGVFYPMFINNTFLSFNFINMIIGGRLRTGAFGDINSLFYCYEDINATNTKNYVLNKILYYLRLDELRGMNDKLISLNDIEFFNTRIYTKDLPTRPRFLKLKHDEGEFQSPPNANKEMKANLLKFNQKMQEINKNEMKRDLYNQYRLKESPELKAIDAYHTAMNYLDDIYMNCFNTNLKDNTPNLQKHREFLRALNIIGENNIKALYVGINRKDNQLKTTNTLQLDNGSKNQEQDKQEFRPKFIGRLATTIIMKDGLYIG